MTTPSIASHLTSVQTFFSALEGHDLEAIEPLLAEDVVEVVPLSVSGGQEPQAVFDGKPAVLGYLESIVRNFSRTALLDRKLTAGTDGGTVFAEARGDLIQAATGAPYRNVYVFKFEFRDSVMVHIAEYANPVTFAKAFGEPIG